MNCFALQQHRYGQLENRTNFATIGILRNYA
jgi:hypothetical protein